MRDKYSDIIYIYIYIYTHTYIYICIYRRTPLFVCHSFPYASEYNCSTCTLACCVRYCASSYWSRGTQTFIFKKQHATQEKKLARGQARTHKHRLQVRLPPLRSHLAKGSLQKWGDAIYLYMSLFLHFWGPWQKCLKWSGKRSRAVVSYESRPCRHVEQNICCFW